MDLKNIHKSPTVRGILIGLAVIVVMLLIFQAGQVTGYRKARFAGNFGNNFERNFLGPRGGEMKIMFNSSIPGGYGAIGKIATITLPQIVVIGPDNIEKIISVGTTTQIHRFQEEIKASDLKTGDSIIVLGSPNESGQIEAKLIRVMPEPGEEFTRMIHR